MANESAGGADAQSRSSALKIGLGLGAMALVAGLAALGLSRPDLAAHDHELELTEGPSRAAARQDPASLAGHVLTQIYSAFGEREEGAIYDALAGVAAGEVLEDLYLQKRAALLDDATGATGQRLHGLEILDVTAEETGSGFVLTARWQAIGAVEHGDHTHIRGNIYGGRLQVEPLSGRWRLTGFALIDVARVTQDR
ncbi:MAG: hypothetical protein ACFBRM_07385 [Pikeienuella sp.]